MKTHLGTTTVGLLALTSLASAGSFDFDGALHAANNTGIPWVATSTMWGTVETGGGTATAQSGFAYFATHAITQLTFTFGDLELTSSASPTPTTPGFERYTENDGSIVPFSLIWNGTEIASGTSLFLRSHVDHDMDFSATGTGQFQITTPGTDPTFFAEVMALTGGSGLFDVAISDFAAIDNLGNFSTSGTMTAVPEPATFAAGASLALLAFAAFRRARRQAA